MHFSELIIFAWILMDKYTSFHRGIAATHQTLSSSINIEPVAQTVLKEHFWLSVIGKNIGMTIYFFADGGV